MPCSCKSSVTSLVSSIKPMNVFYIWYAELCRRSNTSPLGIVKPPKPKNDTVLEFTADRIKPEEWTPILNALRLDTSLHVITIRSRIAGCKFLYEVNTEDKVRRMARRSASLWTDYILRSLVRSLSCCVKNSEVLSSLELDGIPLSMEYLEMLLENLKNNRIIKILSLKHCPINDDGCQQLCQHLRLMPNVEVLNLSSCNLGSISGLHIARIIKHQQINRYCESWHKSLRYADPSVSIMPGLKRITLNNNPNLGDAGLTYILDELQDDLWIKAIDMQKCGITEDTSRRLIDTVQYSTSLEVADFRNNDQLSSSTIEAILQILSKKQQLGLDPEYQWCGTTTTLYDFSTCKSSCSTVSVLSSVVQKSKSAPLRQVSTEAKNSPRPSVRRTRTVTAIDKKPRLVANLTIPKKNQLDDAKKKLIELNTKLQLETLKRRQTERMNNQLQQKMKLIKKKDDDDISDQQNQICKVIRLIEGLGLRDSDEAVPAIADALSKRDLQLKPSKSKTVNKAPTKKVAKPTRKVTIEQPRARPKTPKKTFKGETKSKTPKQITKEIMTPKTEKAPIRTLDEQKALAQTIFEKFLFKDGSNYETVEDSNDDEVDSENVLSYYYDMESDDEDAHTYQKVQLTTNNFGSETSLTKSNASLERFLQEMVVDEELQFEKNQAAGDTSSIYTRDSSRDSENNPFRKFMVQVR